MLFGLLQIALVEPVASVLQEMNEIFKQEIKHLRTLHEFGSFDTSALV